MHPFYELQREIENMPGACYFAAHFPSVASAVQDLNSLSFVEISAAGVANLPKGVRCGIAPMEDNSAAVFLGGIMSAKQRTEAFDLLDRVAHDGLVVVLPPGSEPLRTHSLAARGTARGPSSAAVDRHHVEAQKGGGVLLLFAAIGFLLVIAGIVAAIGEQIGWW